MREALRWLCLGLVLCGATASWAKEPLAPAPVDCGTVDCEGIREMRALFNAELYFLQLTDQFSEDLPRIGFAPPACADGSRVRDPGPGWVAGCRFVYRVIEVSSRLPERFFTAIAQGAAGTEAEGVLLRFTWPDRERPTFWLQRGSVRRPVELDECLPPESFTCSAQLREGTRALRDLFYAELSFWQEKERHSSDFRELGFWPLGCLDGTNPELPDATWIGGCRFIYHVELRSKSGGVSFSARGVKGAVQGVKLSMDESGVMSVTPVPFTDCD